MTYKFVICVKFVIYVVLFVIRVVLLLTVRFYVFFMCKCVPPPGVNPIAVDKYINIDTKTHKHTQFSNAKVGGAYMEMKFPSGVSMTTQMRHLSFSQRSHGRLKFSERCTAPPKRPYQSTKSNIPTDLILQAQ
jgi:hypothetical protein